MSKIEFTGSLTHRLRSLWAISRIGMGVHARHLRGRKMAADWDADTEIGVLFWRHQFTVAMTHPDIAAGRRIFDSLLTLTDDVYDVEISPQTTPGGRWYVPKTLKTQTVLMYCHGGGYTFRSQISLRFAAMLSHHIGARLYMPTYRLTPEHPHPAQADDALRAWQYLRQTHDAGDLVVIGDSAGGHMALNLLTTLRDKDMDQPALCVALCPWTDIGDRGASLYTNNRYDLVQGWMALRFGQWLDPEGRYGRKALSPIHQDFAGLAPIYIQAGGREMLRDMIIDFADVQSQNGASILFDLWDDMPHDFQAYDSFHISSTQALGRISTIIHGLKAGPPSLPPLPTVTQVASGQFQTQPDSIPAKVVPC